MAPRINTSYPSKSINELQKTHLDTITCFANDDFIKNAKTIVSDLILGMCHYFSEVYKILESDSFIRNYKLYFCWTVLLEILCDISILLPTYMSSTFHLHVTQHIFILTELLEETVIFLSLFQTNGINRRNIHTFVEPDEGNRQDTGSLCKSAVNLNTKNITDPFIKMRGNSATSLNEKHEQKEKEDGKGAGLQMYKIKYSSHPFSFLSIYSGETEKEDENDAFVNVFDVDENQKENNCEVVNMFDNQCYNVPVCTCKVDGETLRNRFRHPWFNSDKMDNSTQVEMSQSQTSCDKVRTAEAHKTEKPINTKDPTTNECTKRSAFNNNRYGNPQTYKDDPFQVEYPSQNSDHFTCASTEEENNLENETSAKYTDIKSVSDLYNWTVSPSLELSSADLQNLPVKHSEKDIQTQVVDGAVPLSIQRKHSSFDPANKMTDIESIPTVQEEQELLPTLPLLMDVISTHILDDEYEARMVDNPEVEELTSEASHFHEKKEGHAGRIASKADDHLSKDMIVKYDEKLLMDDEESNQNVCILTYPSNGFRRYSHHRRMILELSSYLKKTRLQDINAEILLDSKTPEETSIGVLCDPNVNWTRIEQLSTLISEKKSISWKRMVLNKAVEQVDCLIIPPDEDDRFWIQQIQEATNQLSCQRDSQLIVIARGQEEDGNRRATVDRKEDIWHARIPFHDKSVKTTVSSAIEKRLLNRLEKLIPKLEIFSHKKGVEGCLNEALSIKNSLVDYSSLESKVGNEPLIPTDIDRVIKKNIKDIQSYGVIRGKIRIKVKRENYTKIMKEFEAWPSHVIVRTADDKRGGAVPLVSQGSKLWTENQSYGTLGSFAKMGDNKKTIILTAAHAFPKDSSIYVERHPGERYILGKSIIDTDSVVQTGSEYKSYDVERNQIVEKKKKEIGIGGKENGRCPKIRSEEEEGSIDHDNGYYDLSVVEIYNNDLIGEINHFYYDDEDKEEKTCKTASFCEDAHKFVSRNKKVSKIGASTNWTHGVVVGIDKVRKKENDDYFLDHLIVKGQFDTTFARGGDSGAIVSHIEKHYDTSEKDLLTYVAMVYAGESDDDHTDAEEETNEGSCDEETSEHSTSDQSNDTDVSIYDKSVICSVLKRNLEQIEEYKIDLDLGD